MSTNFVMCKIQIQIDNEKSKVSELSKFYLMLCIRTARRKQDCKIQISSIEKKKWQVNHVQNKKILGKEICELRKTRNAISKKKKQNFCMFT